MMLLKDKQVLCTVGKSYLVVAGNARYMIRDREKIKLILCKNGTMTLLLMNEQLVVQ